MSRSRGNELKRSGCRCFLCDSSLYLDTKASDRRKLQDCTDETVAMEYLNAEGWSDCDVGDDDPTVDEWTIPPSPHIAAKLAGLQDVEWELEEDERKF